ncbi:MAG TPA: hypothetical protein VGG20_26475 [Thermoanaerobaculia bacterium]|jgi:hypothetical protein
MKLRSTLLFLGSLLLTGSLAVAATAPASDVPAAPVAPAAVAADSPVVPSPLCPANASKVVLPTGNQVVPPFEQKTSVCGACSDVWCAGQTLGALCRTGKRCYNLYGNFCAQDGGSACTCYSGQLP